MPHGSITVFSFVTSRRNIRARLQKSDYIELEMRTLIKVALMCLFSLEELSRVQSVEQVMCTSPPMCRYVGSPVSVCIRFGFTSYLRRPAMTRFGTQQVREMKDSLFPKESLPDDPSTSLRALKK